MSEDIKIILFIASCNTTKTHDWFTTFKDREVEKVLMDHVWYDEDSGYSFDEKGRLFVPSFDKKEKGVYILSFTHKEEGKPDLVITAKYDHNVGTVTVEGKGFIRALIKLYLK